GRSARRRPGLPPDALCGQRGGAARPGRGPRRGRPRHRLHPGPVRRRPPGRDCRAAWPPGPAAAGPGLCPADRAAGAQFAAAAALRPADAGLPGLPGGAPPDRHRRPHPGRGPPAAHGGPMVADPAAAGLRPVAVPARRAPAASAEGGGMRSLVRLHDLYIGRVVLASVLLTWAVLVGLDVVLALSGQLGDLGKGSYDFPTALAVVAYSVPRRAYTIFPYAAVIGSLLGLGQLAGTSELTALRALGLSRRRLSISVAAALVLLTALMVLTGETLAPWGQRQADQLKLAAKNNNVAMARYSGLWAREGDTFLNAVDGQERVEGGQRVLELRDVRLYQVGGDGRLLALTRAGMAVHDAGGWKLRQVRRVAFGEASAVQTTAEEQRWNSELDPNALAAGVTRPRNLSAADLQASIEYRRRNGLDARDYEDTYWSRW